VDRTPLRKNCLHSKPKGNLQGGGGTEEEGPSKRVNMCPPNFFEWFTRKSKSHMGGGVHKEKPKKRIKNAEKKRPHPWVK